MAEGIEEAENNNNSSGEAAAAMLGAVMPCEMTGPNLGVLKRELEIVAATGASTQATTPTLQQLPINLKSEVSFFFVCCTISHRFRLKHTCTFNNYLRKHNLNNL